MNSGFDFMHGLLDQLTQRVVARLGRSFWRIQRFGDWEFGTLANSGAASTGAANAALSRTAENTAAEDAATTVRRRAWGGAED